MGILDELRAAAGKLLNRKVQQKSSNACALEGKYSAGITSSVSKIGGSVKYDGAQKTDDYVFYPDGREKIGRILSKLTKFAVVSAVDESLKTVAGQNPLSLSLSHTHTQSHFFSHSLSLAYSIPIHTLLRVCVWGRLCPFSVCFSLYT